MGDLGIDPRDGAVLWHRIREQLPRYGQSPAKVLYANIVNALRECLHPGAAPTDHEPF